MNPLQVRRKNARTLPTSFFLTRFELFLLLSVAALASKRLDLLLRQEWGGGVYGLKAFLLLMFESKNYAIR